MANGAFTLQGFESPEEVQARIGKAQQAAFRPQGDINSMIYQTAAQGAAGIGGALAGALGYEDPTVKSAKNVQSILKGIDLSSSESLYDAANKLNEAGKTEQAFKVLSKGHEVRKLEEDERTGGIGDGTSEFERLLIGQLQRGEITASEYQKRIDKRTATLSGTQLKKSQQESLDFRRSKQKEVLISSERKQAGEAISYFGDMNQKITGALQAMESGNTALSDTMVAQAMAGIQDSKVRAYQMYKEFDTTYGNVAERAVRGMGSFLTGGKTDAEKAVIKETLVNLRDSYILPAANKSRTFHRNNAFMRGLDPFKVVPPRTPNEIRDYPNMSKEDKLKYLKTYFSGKFQ